jgi:hypothetical protein
MSYYWERKRKPPTEEQIKAACEKIQSGWTDHEREQRRVGSSIEPPVIAGDADIPDGLDTQWCNLS